MVLGRGKYLDPLIRVRDSQTTKSRVKDCSRKQM